MSEFSVTPVPWSNTSTSSGHSPWDRIEALSLSTHCCREALQGAQMWDVACHVHPASPSTTADLGGRPDRKWRKRGAPQSDDGPGVRVAEGASGASAAAVCPCSDSLGISFGLRESHRTTTPGCPLRAHRTAPRGRHEHRSLLSMVP